MALLTQLPTDCAGAHPLTHTYIRACLCAAACERNWLDWLISPSYCHFSSSSHLILTGFESSIVNQLASFRKHLYGFNHSPLEKAQPPGDSQVWNHQTKVPFLGRFFFSPVFCHRGCDLDRTGRQGTSDPVTNTTYHPSLVGT